jgi:hypothetical protein
MISHTLAWALDFCLHRERQIMALRPLTSDEQDFLRPDMLALHAQAMRLIALEILSCPV